MAGRNITDARGEDTWMYEGTGGKVTWQRSQQTGRLISGRRILENGSTVRRRREHRSGGATKRSGHRLTDGKFWKISAVGWRPTDPKARVDFAARPWFNL